MQRVFDIRSLRPEVQVWHNRRCYLDTNLLHANQSKAFHRLCASRAEFMTPVVEKAGESHQ